MSDEKKPEPTAEQVALARRNTEQWLASVGNTEGWTADQYALLKNTVAKDATPDELRLFGTVCVRTRLDPFVKQIYFIKRWDSRANDSKGGMVGAFQVGIDGFRVIAERNGNYAGKIREEWCAKDGKWADLWLSDDPPFAARVTVRRRDWPEPVTFIARWSAYVQRTREGEVTSMWRTRGPEQLAKCAEVGALKIVAPNDLSGLELMDESADVVARDDRPLSITPYTNEARAAAEAAKAAAGAALGGPAPAHEPSGATVVGCEAQGVANTDSSATPNGGSAPPAEPSTPPDPNYEAEVRAILAELYGGPKVFSVRGGPAKLASARKALVEWAVRGGLAPAVIDEKAMYGFAVAYREHKAKQAGEAGTDTAAVGTEPAPATEGSGGNDESIPAGGADESGTEAVLPPEFDHANFIERCKAAARVFGIDKRPFIVKDNGVLWFVDALILDAIGCSESLPIGAQYAETTPLLDAALPKVVEAMQQHERNVKPAPRGPSPL